MPAERERLVHVPATAVNRTDCGNRAAVLHRGFQPDPPAEGRGPRDRVRGRCRDPLARRDAVLGRRQVRIPRGWLRSARPVRRGRGGAHGRRLPESLTFAETAPSTEGAHCALAFVRRAGTRAVSGAPSRRDGRAVGPAAAAEILAGIVMVVTAVCVREKLDPGAGFRHQAGYRLHLRGLHAGQRDGRQRDRHGRQEHLWPLSAAPRPSWHLPLQRPGACGQNLGLPLVTRPVPPQTGGLSNCRRRTTR